MAGAKVSQLAAASGVTDADLLYLVNNGSPRKFTLADFSTFLKGYASLVVSVNGVAPVSNALTLTKANIGLGNVPNVSPVTSLNTLAGDVTIPSNASIVATTDALAKTLTLTVNPAFTLDWSKLTGTWQSQGSLAAAMASVGIQGAPRECTGGSFQPSDTTVHWVNVTVLSASQILIPEGMNAPIGAVIEVRQGGVGMVTVAPATPQVVLSQPSGVIYSTSGLGSRIQIVSLGGDAWEIR